MHTRSSSRRHQSSWFDTVASLGLDRANNNQRRERERPAARSRRRQSPTPRGPSPHRTLQSIDPPFPVTASSSLLSPDALLRNVAVVAIFVTVALLFLNVALNVALVFVAFLVPSWRTFKALESPDDHPVHIVHLDHDEDHDDVSSSHGDFPDDLMSSGPLPRSVALAVHMKYWMLLAVLVASHVVFYPTMSVLVPQALYRAVALWVFVWLNASHGANAQRTYDATLRPTLIRFESAVDIGVAALMRNVDFVTRHIILGVSQAVEPYARQLEHAAAVTRRQMEEQDRPNHGPIEAGYFD